ncbi:MAG: peptidoglycan-binding domain-containing protein [Stellaceae bacterium]
MKVYGVVALGLLTAACGSSGDQRAATGGLAGVGALAEADFRPVAGSGPSDSSALLVRQAQSELKRESLYEGRVDGIAGPKTKQGIIAFQRREGLQQTARLDDATRDRMILNALRMDSAWSETIQNNAAEASGSSTPPSTSQAARSDDAGGIGTGR